MTMIKSFALVGAPLLLLLGALMAAVVASSSGDSSCRLGISESMPEKLELDSAPGVTVTHEDLIAMIDNTQETLHIASFYLMLTPMDISEQHSSMEPGRRLREAIRKAGERGVDVQIVLDNSTPKSMNNPEDVAYLKDAATIHLLNLKSLHGSGVQHSKFLVADNQTFYVGSSNFDWRSYAHVKEIGLTGYQCPELAQDLDKIFSTYVKMAHSEQVPLEQEMAQFATKINERAPLETNGLRIYLGGSPPDFFPAAATNRTDDIDGLLHVINSARKTLDISVMNYAPRFYSRVYWPLIDDALRRAAVERQVRVRILFSDWQNTRELDLVWYRSLNALQSPSFRGGGIHLKLFKVPAFDAFQAALPYARVKHDKYMISERTLFIGTSNWTPDYFTKTCGVGVVMEGNGGEKGAEEAPIVRAMRATFERDFNSQFAHEL